MYYHGFWKGLQLHIIITPTLNVGAYARCRRVVKQFFQNCGTGQTAKTLYRIYVFYVFPCGCCKGRTFSEYIGCREDFLQLTRVVETIS